LAERSPCARRYAPPWGGTAGKGEWSCFGGRGNKKKNGGSSIGDEKEPNGGRGEIPPRASRGWESLEKGESEGSSSWLNQEEGLFTSVPFEEKSKEKKTISQARGKQKPGAGFLCLSDRKKAVRRKKKRGKTICTGAQRKEKRERPP